MVVAKCMVVTSLLLLVLVLICYILLIEILLFGRSSSNFHTQGISRPTVQHQALYKMWTLSLRVICDHWSLYSHLLLQSCTLILFRYSRTWFYYLPLRWPLHFVWLPLLKLPNSFSCFLYTRPFHLILWTLITLTIFSSCNTLSISALGVYLHSSPNLYIP